MSQSETITLRAEPREGAGSREARRLRRRSRVPGVLYGGDGDAVAFDVDARELRHALQGAALLDLVIGDAPPQPALLKDRQRHPVRMETTHVDFVRVRLDQAVQSTVQLQVTGFEDAPGARAGGVLEQTAREITIEALPAEIPDAIVFDASELEIGDTVTLDRVSAPAGATIVDDPETVVATVTAPRLRTEASEEIEQETELVGEGPDGSAAADGGDETEGE